MKKTLLAALVALAMPLMSEATTITSTVTVTSGNLAASADFSFDDVTNVLTVTLTNTSTADVLVPTDVLTALLFNLTGGATLTPVSALLGSGSTVYYGPDGGGNVGGEWAYAQPGGISSSGLGIFGSGNFNGSNLVDPAAVDGLQYGITSAGDNLATGNAPVTGGNALIKNSVVFTLNVNEAGGQFFLNNITGILFQYGTSLDDVHTTTGDITVPDGGMTLSLLGLALGSLGLVARRRA